MPKVECLICGRIFSVPSDGSPIPPHETSDIEKEGGLQTCPGSEVDGLLVPDDS